jgi:hypothetical protein
MVMVGRPIPARLEFEHRVAVEAKQEEVVLADVLADFDVGAIEGSNRERAVEGELHVAGAGGFLAREGDLLGEIRGGIDAFAE